MKKNIILLVMFLFPGSMLFAQQNEPMADRIEDLLKHDVFSVGLLLQSEAVFSFSDDNFNGGRAFGLGATRLDFSGRVDNNYIYKLQLDFTRPGNLVDANVGYLFSDEFRIITGLTKPSLSRDLDPSPADTDFIDRARLVGAMMNPRELGVMFLGESGNFNFMLGMFNGTGFSMNNDNRFMYATRLAIILKPITDHSMQDSMVHSIKPGMKALEIPAWFHKATGFSTVPFLNTTAGRFSEPLSLCKHVLTHKILEERKRPSPAFTALLEQIFQIKASCLFATTK
jgi:hypothetical protein